jgi:hypothetical protein
MFHVEHGPTFAGIDTIHDKNHSCRAQGPVHWGPEFPSRSVAMKINEGGLDRVVRVVVGLALIALAATGTVGWWGYIGIVPLITGAVGVCPAYSLLGLNTCPMKKSS